MIDKKLKSGIVSYYWNPPTRDRKAGFPLHPEALGEDFPTAARRAEDLNRHLHSWRHGKDATKSLDLQPGFGTLRWLIERYKRTRAWSRVSDRSRPEYERIFRLVTEFPTKNDGTVGDAPLQTIDARAVDKLYDRIRQSGTQGERLRTANLCISRVARAWEAVARHYPKVVPADNPFRGVEMIHGKGTTRPATRAEAFALHAALVEAGHPHLAVVPLICFEWHQRPENVIAGELAWNDICPPDRPHHVHIVHHKTQEFVWLPTRDTEGDLFPELLAYLADLPRLGVPVVLREDRKGNAILYKQRHARAAVRAAARAADLPDWLTLAACRHGGMTELGDAGLTEQGVRALSGHRTADAARLYVKRTEAQRLAAARKRRAWVQEEQMREKSQNGPDSESQNERRSNY